MQLISTAKQIFLPLVSLVLLTVAAFALQPGTGVGAVGCGESLFDKYRS